MQSATISLPLFKKLTQEFFLALLVALSFSAFIYLSHWDITLKWLNSLLALGALYALLTQNRNVLLFSGFLIGLLWFYWIGYSFAYYDVAWMTPFVTIGFGFVYLLFFGFLSLTRNIWLRALGIFALTYLEPLDFNWMQI